MGDGRGEAQAAMRVVGYGDSDWAYDFLEQKPHPVGNGWGNITTKDLGAIMKTAQHDYLVRYRRMY